MLNYAELVLLGRRRKGTEHPPATGIMSNLYDKVPHNVRTSDLSICSLSRPVSLVT